MGMIFAWIEQCLSQYNFLNFIQDMFRDMIAFNFGNMFHYLQRTRRRSKEHKTELIQKVPP